MSEVKAVFFGPRDGTKLKQTQLGNVRRFLSDAPEFPDEPLHTLSRGVGSIWDSLKLEMDQ